MKMQITIRGVIVLLAATTTVAGVWCVFEKRSAATESSNVANMQAQLQNDLITVARLHKDLTATSNAPAPSFDLPKDPEESSVIRELQALSSQANVSLGGVVFTDTAKSNVEKTQDIPKTGPSIQTAIQASGHRESLLKFIHFVQSNQRMVLVNNVQITTGNDASTSQLTMQLTFPYGG